MSHASRRRGLRALGSLALAGLACGPLGGCTQYYVYGEGPLACPPNSVIVGPAPVRVRPAPYVYGDVCALPDPLDGEVVVVEDDGPPLDDAPRVAALPPRPRRAPVVSVPSGGWGRAAPEGARTVIEGGIDEDELLR